MLWRLRWIVGFVLMMLSAATATYAAEIHLKAQAVVPGQTVRLADVAEIHGGSASGASASGGSSEAQQLGQIELFPVPSQEQYITAQQVREALLGRGVDLRQHTISGASMIVLMPEDRSVSTAIFGRRSATADEESADHGASAAAAAIVRFLKSQVDAELPWKVDLAPADEQSRPDARADAHGGEAGADPRAANATDFAVTQTERRPERGSLRPWLGRQQFVMRWNVAGRRREGIVAAEVKLPATVVVAARDLARGAVLQLADLKTKPAGDQERSVKGFEFTEDAVGKQLSRPLHVGHVIEAEGVDSPDLVRRGERVSIVVNHHGVRVRTEGRARDGGPRGDVVVVESADRRNAFQAVVTGVNEVQVEVGNSQAQVADRPKRETRQR
jgi:flagella basal body P-ring formation protein FlgA